MNVIYENEDFYLFDDGSYCFKSGPMVSVAGMFHMEDCERIIENFKDMQKIRNRPKEVEEVI